MKKIGMIMFTLCLLVSCSNLRVQSWMDPAFEDRAIGKTMILGVAASDSRSRQYEALFAESLTEVGVETDSLHALVQSTDKLTEEELVAALQKNKYDSIIVTRTLSETERQQVVPSGYYPSHYGSYYGFYSHAYTLSGDTVTVQSSLEFELETNLYDVETRKLVWSGRKRVSDTSSDLKNMKKIIRSVVKDLGRKGLL